ncbi:MAG: hypothetical protein U5L11_12485 [Arhodomonas sp.]|nr:hypothetical protein [Arhodomonas sp.]
MDRPIPLCELDQQVHGHHRLARARPALDDEHLLAAVLRQVSHFQRCLVDELLIVDHQELAVAAHQSRQGIGEVTGRANVALFDTVEDAVVIALAYVLPDKAP